jgi:hypothetical protein
VNQMDTYTLEGLIIQVLALLWKSWLFDPSHLTSLFFEVAFRFLTFVEVGTPPIALSQVRSCTWPPTKGIS